MKMDEVMVYTDGGCSPNPGLGAWSAILVSPAHDNYTRELWGVEPRSTNNRMELTAAIRALESLKRPCRVTIHTDSQYLKKAFTDGWIKRWLANGWKTSEKQPVTNKDLWKELIDLCEKHKVSWVWVRGHGYEKYNIRCDMLVSQARSEFLKSVKKKKSKIVKPAS